MITLFRSIFAPPRHLILLIAALWLGLYLSEKRAQRYRISKDALNTIVYYGILGYIVGGRVLFVLENLAAFTGSPQSIFSINVDLFDPVGAFGVAILVAFIYGRRQKLPLWSMLDTLTPLLAILAIGLPLSHLAAGTAFGNPTNLPWGIELWNATRHPTQIYEFVGSLLIFGLVWFRKTDTPPGSAFLMFAALMAGAHLFLEAFRGDSTLIVGGIRLAQVIAWLVLATALFAGEATRKVGKVK
jgi:phosphatidylglycerol---prolipoprotein diacylglyceryl transferase